LSHFLTLHTINSTTAFINVHFNIYSTSAFFYSKVLSVNIT